MNSILDDMDPQKHVDTSTVERLTVTPPDEPKKEPATIPIDYSIPHSDLREFLNEWLLYLQNDIGKHGCETAKTAKTHCFECDQRRIEIAILKKVFGI